VSDALANVALGVVSETIGPLFQRLISLIPDKEKAAEQAFEMNKLLLQLDTDFAKSQMAINEKEASSNSLFVAGGRPAIIWICATALGWQVIGVPFFSFWLAVLHYSVTLPSIDSSYLSLLLLPLLGLSGMRSVDKYNGVQTNSITPQPRPQPIAYATPAMQQTSAQGNG
jgi:hypothetical protein